MSGMIEQERYTCAIGALQSVVAIPRAVPILHSGPGCGTLFKGEIQKTAQKFLGLVRSDWNIRKLKVRLVIKFM
ncbi:hypothetical protein AGMMS49975_12980 [Clostridia bacterium]|nr:hypothetical protein AGMMS49975_12980 [Clostridia bacterium]